MGDYEIGITGIQVAQNAMDIIGNNIANAATDGYHRQELDIRPRADAMTNGLLIGQGVESTGIRRNINQLLDREILSKESNLKQIERELDALISLEASFGELTTSALSSALDDFYNSLHKLSEEPTQVVYQSDVISTANSLSNQLRSIGSTVADLETKAYTEAQTTVEQINDFSAQIAELNRQIHYSVVRGIDPNNLMDQRDQLVTEMGHLVGVSVTDRENGTVDVTVGDTPVVMNTTVINLEVGLSVNGDEYDLVVSPEDQELWTTDITGGRLGGLFSLRNDIVREIGNRLDNLARNVIFETNNLHVQGVGTHGSFEELTGWTMSTLDLADMDPPVSNGTLYIRCIDDTGVMRRNSVAVNTADTLTTVATDISNLTFDFGGGPVTPIDAAVVGNKLQISIDPAFTDYKFDFLPGALDEPTTSTLTGGAGNLAPSVTVSGTYTGSSDETYTCTVMGTADNFIGNGDIYLRVTDSAGQVVDIDIGDGYESGKAMLIEDGIKVALGSNGAEAGYVQVGQVFTIEALANSDSSGVLAAAGINTFFKGTGATSIAVSDDIDENLNRIAIRRGVEMSDNLNALSIARLGDTAMTDLNDVTPKEYYRRTATNVGEQLAATEISQENTYGVWRSLSAQRDDISGVDMNDEAAKMLVFERMFQGMAKYMNVVSRTTDQLMGIVT